MKKILSLCLIFVFLLTGCVMNRDLEGSDYNINFDQGFTSITVRVNANTRIKEIQFNAVIKNTSGQTLRSEKVVMRDIEMGEARTYTLSSTFFDTFSGGSVGATNVTGRASRF